VIAIALDHLPLIRRQTYEVGWTVEKKTVDWREVKQESVGVGVRV
jgi:hypothetical protein